MSARERELLDTIEDLVRQFAYASDGRHGGGGPAYSTGGLSALENAFSVLGWDDPQSAPEMQCQHPGCVRWATSGIPTKEGYKRCCYEHFKAYRKAEEGEKE